MAFEDQAQVESQLVQEGDSWKIRFFTIWAGQSISLIGSALAQFVLIWWITQTTGSATALAFASIIGMLPQAIFTPLGGVLADRWNRRLIMIVSDSISALCMIVLVLLFRTDSIELWHVYSLMFVRSTMQAFQGPAAIASTTLLVPDSWLTRVAGLNQTVTGLMLITSAPLGALALSVFPLEGALLIDVATAIIGILPLLIFKIPQPVRHNLEHNTAWSDFRAGLQFVLQQRGLALLYGITVLMMMVLVPALAMAPLFVLEHFGGGVEQIALLESANGIGMLIGGLIISFIVLPVRRIVVVLLGFASSCFTIMMAGFAPSDMFWLAASWWFISGIPYTIGNGPIIAILQHIIPLEMQGRALSLLTSLLNLAGPLGLVAAAPLGDYFGARSVLISGGGLAAIICLFGLCLPSLIRIEEQGRATSVGS
jgi:DHA3 family macrolide efflux protein-like MFS transporter